MGGVQDELALHRLTLLDGAQEAVEDATQTTQLVDVALLEASRHVVGLGDLLDVVGDVLERVQRGARQQDSQGEGQEQDAGGDQQQGAHQTAQLRDLTREGDQVDLGGGDAGLVLAVGEVDGPADGSRDDQFAQVLARDVHGAKDVAGVLGPGEGHDRGVDQAGGLVHRVGGAVGQHQEGAEAGGGVVVGVRGGELQRGVDGVGQGVARREEGDDSGQHHGHGRGDDGGGDDAAAKGHAVRSA